jgi:DNA-binding response OmpR family regulator
MQQAKPVNHILCIEDDPTIQALVKATLSSYRVDPCYQLKEAEFYLKKYIPAAVLLDIGLPDGDGLRLLGTLQQQTQLKQIPVLVFSDRTQISNKVTAFSLGAEDFIPKPFDPLELLARVQSKIKKHQGFQLSFQVGDLWIDREKQSVSRMYESERTSEDARLDLTTIEFKILVLLGQRLEQVYTREQIIDKIWDGVSISDRTVDSHVAHLRKKLKDSSVDIEAVKSVGYKAILK